MIYEIFEGNMERLTKKLTRIANKCSKYGCEFKFEEVGETFRELKDEYGDTYTARFVKVDVEGKAIINNWQFVASVDHTDKGNIINRIGEIEVPEHYYTSKPVCEHCNSSRYRKNTYIVQNTMTGEFKQVGKSCLRDFTGGLSAEAAARYISYFEELIKGEAPYDGCHIEPYTEVQEALQFIAETIRKFGYVKRQEYKRCTADRAGDYYLVYHGRICFPEVRKVLKKEMEEVNFDHNAPEVIEEVKKALEWIAGQEETNNYMHNLKTACSHKYINSKHFGLLASLFPTYNRDLEIQAEKAERERQKASEAEKSQYVGQEKERIVIEVATITVLTRWDTQWGSCALYKIVDVNGNVYVWKTSGYVEQKVKTIKATVKGHAEYRGVKQTEITRGKAVA